MNSNRIYSVIQEAISASVKSIQFNGIFKAVTRNALITPKCLKDLSEQLGRHGQAQTRLSAEIEFLLRVSNIDLFKSVQRIPFRVQITGDEHDPRVLAINEDEWALAWERGIERIKKPALLAMKEDVLEIDPTLTEENPTFRTAMVLLASELVGPWSALVAQFLGYPRAFVEVVAARLYEAKIWENEEVRCERWFDPANKGLALALDLMVAEGMLVRRWSEAKQQFTYCSSDILAAPGHVM